jgi:hypothetical protein
LAAPFTEIANGSMFVSLIADWWRETCSVAGIRQWFHQSAITSDFRYSARFPGNRH